LDFGDAQDPPCPTKKTSGGAGNTVASGLYHLRLGSTVDGEPDGQPDLKALGDDNDKNGDDEDGVTIPAVLIQGQTFKIAMTLSGTGQANWRGWIDWNGNGIWEQNPSEQVIDSTQPVVGIMTITVSGGKFIAGLTIGQGGFITIVLSGGTLQLTAGMQGQVELQGATVTVEYTVQVPQNATLGITYARFRVQENSAPLPTGVSNEFGEVEDYMVEIKEAPVVEEWDFGDAPEGGQFKYPTTLANNGARHKIVQRFCLGNDVDGETDGIPSPDAKGDDHDNRDDEDGVLIPSALTPGTTANITVTVTAAAPVDCYLDAWVDFNCDGDWRDPGEQIFTSKKLTALSNALSFDVPVDAVPGVSFARFRLSKNGGLSYDGEAPDGEVEDYLVEINPAGAQPPAPRPPMGHPKWSQPPVEIGQDGGIPTYSGWNEPSGEVEVESGIWFDCWSSPTQCRGDADCDGDVDLNDFAKLQAAYPCKYGDQCYDACADFDRDLNADLDDLCILQQFFTGPNKPIHGQACPGKPVVRQVLADDWLCKDERVVTDIHWWGSFIGWAARKLPPVYPKAFHIGIWNDVAVGQDPQNPSFSHPGSLIWENLCDNWTWRFDGYDLDPRTQESEKEACFEFTLLLSEDEWFKPDLDARQTPKVYWLSITPIYSLRESEIEYPWGWKTRSHFFNDDAVRVSQSGNVVQGQLYPLSPPALGALWVSGEPITWGESWDLAFELTSNVPDPEKPGRADLNWDGIVDFKDLALLLRWWLTPDP